MTVAPGATDIGEVYLKPLIEMVAAAAAGALEVDVADVDAAGKETADIDGLAADDDCALGGCELLEELQALRATTEAATMGATFQCRNARRVWVSTGVLPFYRVA